MVRGFSEAGVAASLPRSTAKIGRKSAAGHRHEAHNLRRIHLLREVVAEGLDAHAGDDRLAQRGILTWMVTQDRQQVQRIVLPQARVKLALGGDADTVAGVAEIVTVRRNEADPRFRPGNAPVACPTARGFDRRNQVKTLGQPFSCFLGLNIGAVAPVYFPERHFLDEGQVEFMVDRPGK